jgi:hypothetical protein
VGEVEGKRVATREANGFCGGTQSNGGSAAGTLGEVEARKVAESEAAKSTGAACQKAG